MQREFDVVIERDSAGYYVGSVPRCEAVIHSPARWTSSWNECGKRSSSALKLRAKRSSP
jgi:hypothetical protein